jgi:hypothetical protein
MKAYPEIELRWKEVGMSFQIQFVNTKYVEDIANGRFVPKLKAE